MDGVEVEHADVRPVRTAEVVGAVASTAGLPVALTGLLVVVSEASTDDSLVPGAALCVTGVGATIGGPPLLLGAAHRERRILRGQGAEVPGTAGTVGWVLFGAAIGSEAAMVIPALLGEWTPGGEWYFAPAAPYAGAVVAGLVQRGVNRRAGDGLVWDEPRGPRPLLVPHLGATPGLDLVVVF